jgi:hypothetical protein
MIDFEDYKRVIRTNNTSVIKYHLYCNVCNNSKGYQTKDKDIYQCRSCASKREKTKNEIDKIRKGVESFYNKKHKNKPKEEYTKNPKINNYKPTINSRISRECKHRDKKYSIDTRFDFSSQELDFIISKGCYYCGYSDNIGLDRIDNTKGHCKANVIPSCTTCNMTRGNRFTVEEFKKIGQMIKEIKNERLVRLGKRF